MRISVKSLLCEGLTHIRDIKKKQETTTKPVYLATKYKHGKKEGS